MKNTYLRRRPIREDAFDQTSMQMRSVSDIMRETKESRVMRQAMNDRVRKSVADSFVSIRAELDNYSNGSIDRKALNESVAELLSQMHRNVSRIESSALMKVDRYFVDRLCETHWNEIKKSYGG